MSREMINGWMDNQRRCRFIDREMDIWMNRHRDGLINRGININLRLFSVDPEADLPNFIHLNIRTRCCEVSLTNTPKQAPPPGTISRRANRHRNPE